MQYIFLGVYLAFFFGASIGDNKIGKYIIGIAGCVLTILVFTVYKGVF